MKKFMKGLLLTVVIIIVFTDIAGYLWYKNDNGSQKTVGKSNSVSENTSDGSSAVNDISSLLKEQVSEITEDQISKPLINIVDPYWSKVITVDNNEDFMKYYRSCIDKRMTEIPVCFPEGFDMDTGDITYATVQGKLMNSNITTGNFEGKRVKYNIKYYPGSNVADAYFSGDISKLSDDEKQLYNIAVGIVNEANKQPSVLKKELYIHDAIVNATTYYTENDMKDMPRFCTAVGALIDGKANCQGYTDAFYMLGTMCGLKVGKCGGNAVDKNGKSSSADTAHIWNTVELDGWTYFVDVTWDDEAVLSTSTGDAYTTYIYFNVPSDIIKSTHTYKDWYVDGNIAKVPDINYFYSCSEYDGSHFGMYISTGDGALYYAAEQAINYNNTVSYIMIPYDEQFTDADNVSKVFSSMWENLNGPAITYLTNTRTMGDYIFFFVTVEFT